MYNNKFGIVTSFYNCEQYVDSVFESILNQTYKNWIYFVTDDSSSDGTKEKILKYCDNIKIFYVEQKFKKEMFWQPQRFVTPDCDYVITMDSDDYVLPKALEVYNNALNKYKDNNIVFISCDSAWMSEDFNSLLNYTYLYHNKSYYLNDNDVERNRRGIDRVSPNTFGSFRGIKNIKGLDFGVDCYKSSGNNDVLHTGCLQNYGNSLIINRTLYKYRYRASSISHRILTDKEWADTKAIREILKDKVENFDCRVINMQFENLYNDFAALLMCEDLGNVNTNYKINLITKFVNKDFDHLKNVYKEHFIDINNFVDDFDFYVVNLTDYDLNDHIKINKIFNYIKSKNYYKIAIYYHDERSSLEIEANPGLCIDKMNRIVSENLLEYFWTTYYRKYSCLSDNKNYIAADNSVNIINESGSLGDSIAWIPIVNEFAIQKRSKVNLYTPNKELFINEYPMINFYNYCEKPSDDKKDAYKIGCFNESNWKPYSLQEIASNILGIKHKEKKCKLDFDKTKKSNFNKKYVCIATQSTAQCKYWNNKEGWNKVVGYLNSLGYDVVCIDKHYSYGTKDIMNITPENAINKTGDLPLEDRINDLYHCEFFIGLGSGLSWLAWACEKPVIMISGFSDPKSEFYTPYRVHNKNVCNSCWSDVNCTFDRSDWLWCPRDKDFECSREITFDMVKEKIDLCIQDLPKK
jgi:autotransporter strand-loop-strand O-heptosyltransferase